MRREKNASFFAARFAAHEAFVKALGTGFRRGVSIRDIEVKKADLGRPELSFTARVGDMLRANGIARCHLSITHDGDSAQAIVILEGA
jgi:holo-[acyl-carrier protein] synthase